MGECIVGREVQKIIEILIGINIECIRDRGREREEEVTGTKTGIERGIEIKIKILGT